MQPPGYRHADLNIIGMPKKSCFECIRERQFRGRSVCLKYLSWVRIDRTCDSWDGGELRGNAPKLGLYGGFYVHEMHPTAEEEALLQSSQITDG
jgi:hypothetical protein